MSSRRQSSQIRQLRGAGQFFQNATQVDEAIVIEGRRQRRIARPQTGHPTENVGITAQPIQRTNLRMIGAEVGQKVSRRTAIDANRVRSNCRGQRIYGAAEGLGQLMI